ncbi:hypothetical protein ACXG0S_002015 [Campylobacter coli]|nr:hypothetical protein [Campylobacter coli]ECC1278876.1 hypothetical protein [Campylobacter coli]EDD2124052.1 hypothetical protein [Campylobacter coli]ELH4668576.1 hypothetical protein [Campylobacter coli]
MALEASKIKIIDFVYETTKTLSQITEEAVAEMQGLVAKNDGKPVYVRVTDVDQSRVILINSDGKIINNTSNNIVQDKRIDRLIKSLV